MGAKNEFTTWFNGRAQEIHGFDPSAVASGPPSELVVDTEKTAVLGLAERRRTLAGRAQGGSLAPAGGLSRLTPAQPSGHRATAPRERFDGRRAADIERTTPPRRTGTGSSDARGSGRNRHRLLDRACPTIEPHSVQLPS